MSYIHCYNDNYYKPGESLQRLFQDLVVRPFTEHPLTESWENKVINRSSQYHREVILERGSANFNEEFEGLPPADKVSLYCLYYMPMHLFSSYHVFTKYLPPLNNKVIFVDFGCGPLTSGIAFWAAFAGHSDITCISIDESRAMRDKAKDINEYGHRGRRFFTKGKLAPNCNKLYEDLDDYIVNGDQTQIIFNCCYSLARDTLDTEELSVGDLSNVLIQIARKYSQHQMVVIYQNPPIPPGRSLQSSMFHENWYCLKTRLSMFQSQITQSHTEPFSYDSLMDSLCHTREVYFDILSNESSAIFHDPFEFQPIF